jgi:hypothetical protein
MSKTRTSAVEWRQPLISTSCPLPHLGRRPQVTLRTLHHPGLTGVRSLLRNTLCPTQPATDTSRAERGIHIQWHTPGCPRASADARTRTHTEYTTHMAPGQSRLLPARLFAARPLLRERKRQRQQLGLQGLKETCPLPQGWERESKARKLGPGRGAGTEPGPRPPHPEDCGCSRGGLRAHHTRVQGSLRRPIPVLASDHSALAPCAPTEAGSLSTPALPGPCPRTANLRHQVASPLHRSHYLLDPQDLPSAGLCPARSRRSPTPC